MSPICAVVNALDRFLEPVVVAQAEARDDRQVFRLRLFADFQHAAHAGGIDGDRLLGEDVLARGDRGLQMQRAELRRRAEQHDVAAVDDLFDKRRSRRTGVLADVELVARLLRSSAGC